MSNSVRPQRRQPTRLPCPWDSSGKNTGVGCHFLLQCRKVKSEREVAQSCLTLSDSMDCSLLGSAIHGIFQARVLEWGAIAVSIKETAEVFFWSCIPTSNELALCCSTSSPTFGVVSVLGFGHSRCVALSYCYFNLQFPNDIWCQAFLCVLYVSLWLGVCSVPFACFLTGSFFLLRAIYLSCWRRQWQPTPVLLPGKSHGWRSLVSYSPWGH